MSIQQWSQGTTVVCVLLAPGRDGLSTDRSAHPAMHLSTLSSISYFLLLAISHPPFEEETASAATRLFTLGLRHTARDDPHSTANGIVRAMCHPSAQDPVTRDNSVHGNGVRCSS